MQLEFLPVAIDYSICDCASACDKKVERVQVVVSMGRRSGTNFVIPCSQFKNFP